MTLSIRLDAVGGIAGDMFVAALLDARPDLCPRVLHDAAAVLPEGAGTPALDEGLSAGLRCRRFRLDAQTSDKSAPHDRARPTTFREMAALIEAAPLHPGTAANAVAILRLLAGAEAAIHRVPVEEVHFHEIADWDSLMDVTAAGSIAAALEGAVWSVSALPRGDGLVRTRHGMLPVPAPATARLLEGFFLRDEGIGGERVTPTGAAIIRHLVAAPDVRVEGRLLTTGTGGGTRELPGQPNILRATLFETGETAPGEEDIIVLEFEVDDMTGEEIAVAAERLRATVGVRDVMLMPALGKKGRPVQCFRLLVEPAARGPVAGTCFTETATIGLRWQTVRRAVLPRTAAVADGVRIKTVARPDGPSAKAESDDLAAMTGLAARRAAKRRAEDT